MWKASATVYGPYGSRAVTPTVTFSGDRKQLTLTFSDSLLVNSETKCMTAKSSWNEWVSDPAVQPGPYADSTPSFLFDGLECTERPSLSLTAPEQVIIGRQSVITIKAHNAGLEQGTLNYTLASDASPFYTDTFAAGEDLNAQGKKVDYWIQLDEGDGPATVNLAWTQFGGKTCAAAPVTVVPIPGETPRFETKHYYDEGLIILKHGACEDARVGAATVTIFQGSRKRVLTKKDTCGKWTARGSLRGIKVKPDDDRLEITSQGDARAVMVATFAGKKQIRRRIITSHKRYSGYRIYAWNRDGTVNDSYWNTCVNDARNTYMDDGNAYCYEPAYTVRNVKILPF